MPRKTTGKVRTAGKVSNNKTSAVLPLDISGAQSIKGKALTAHVLRSFTGSTAVLPQYMSLLDWQRQPE